VSYSEGDGHFVVEGCGDDHGIYYSYIEDNDLFADWLPGIVNNPEPYLRIHHYCNNERGEMLILPEFHTYVPTTYQVGDIILDDA